MNAFRALLRFCKSRTFDVRPARRIAWRSPRLEALEARETPAGDVTSTFSAGTLTLLGIDDTTKAGVLAGRNDQQITITGGVPGTFTVLGVGGTKINGKAADTFVGVKNLRLDMRLGDDAVTVNSAILSGTLTFNGGSGNDTLTIGGVAGPQIFGAVTVNGGDGGDALLIGNGINAITGALTFNGGSGNSTVTIGIVPADQLTVGRINVTNGEGNDVFNVGGAKLNVGADVTISNGITASSTTKLAATAVSLGGNLAITNLAGVDGVTLGSAAGAFVGKSVAINNGDGNATVNFAAKSHEFTGNIAVTNGTGFDAVTLGSMTIAGNVTINNRAGGSTTACKGDTLAIHGNLSVSSSGGFDTLMADCANLTVHGAVSVNTGAGGSYTLLAPTSHLTVDRATTVTCGSEFDTVSIGTPLTTTSLNGVSINVGNGGSITEFDGPSELAGNLTINSQEGLDNFKAAGTLTVGGNTAFNLGAGPFAVNFLGMGTVLQGSLSVRGLDGADTFKTGGVGFTVNGAANFSPGDGGLILDLASIDNTFGSPLTISAGTGVNTLNFTGTLTGKSVTINSTGTTKASFLDVLSIQGNLNVTTGLGDDTVKFVAPVYVSGTVGLTTGGGMDEIDWTPPGATILRGVTIRTGDGADAVILGTTTFGSSVSIDLGSLHDDLQIDDCVFFGAVSINTGTGSDLVRIEQVDSGSPTEFKGTVAVRLGDGDDNLTIGIEADVNDRAIFSAPVTFDGGAGLDIAAVLPITDGGTRNNIFANFPTFIGIEAPT